MISGPIPVREAEIRSNRDEIRLKSFEIRKSTGILIQNVQNTPTLIEAYPAASSCLTHRENRTPKLPDQVRNRSATQTRTESLEYSGSSQQNRPLSSRYRWIDFDVQEDIGSDEGESDNDDYNPNFPSHENELNSPNSPRQRRRNNSSNSARTRRRNNRSATHRNEQRELIENIEPTRVSSRQAARRPITQDYYDDDLDEICEQMLSSNTTPSGEYEMDYEGGLGHIFKLTSDKIQREWVMQQSCIEGYTGLKAYIPQVGDSIVYIPGAHLDTIKAYPMCTTSDTGSPWESWPTKWPLVQCDVTNIRYRFPYANQ